MKSIHQKSVEEFMRHARQDVPDRPHVPSPEARILRAKLLYEETMETIAALGVSVQHIFEDANAEGEIAPRFVIDGDPDLVEIIDGCCDIAVVTTGTLSACGVPDEPFQQAVNANNLAKFGPGHSWREDGKLIKPPGHKPPDLHGILQSLMTDSIDDAA